MNELFRRILRLLLGPSGPSFDARGRIAASDGSTVLLAAGPEPAGREPRGGDAPASASDASAAEGERRRPATFLLSVDDAGQFLVALGERLVLGHLRGGRADLPFLADVGTTHARLLRKESFREGATWWIEPLGGEEVRIDGRRVEGAEPMESGDRVTLGANLAFRYRIPDPASATVLLELEDSAECGGARTIVLFAEDEGGRLRIGPAEHRHVRVPRLEHEVTLLRRGTRLEVACEAPIVGAEHDERGFSLPLPPPQRIDLSIGKPSGSRPPFGLAIEPSEVER